MNPIDVRIVLPGQLDEAASVVARGMSDNPHHVRDFGTDPGHRIRRCDRLYRAVLPLINSHGWILGAHRDGAMIGALGVTEPRCCRPPLGVQVRLAGRLLVDLGLGPGLSTLRWLKARAAYDPREPHWHLGPVAVDAGLQGHGIGTSLMHDFCNRIAGSRPEIPVFLETESSINERFGFRTVGERSVLGVHTWLMTKPGRPAC